MENMYLRRENETDSQYQSRLSLGKLLDGWDLEWQDIKELLNSDKHRDTIRREGYGIKIKYEADITKTKEQIGDEAYQKLIDKEIQLDLKKIKVQDMTTRLKKMERDYARRDDLGEILERKMEELNMCPKIINNEYKDRTASGKQAIAMWSDWHYGIVCDGFLNKYDSDVCKQRLNILVDKTIEYCKLNNVDILNIFCMGDFISAENYNTIRLQNREHLMEQIADIIDLLEEAIIKLANNLKDSYIMVGVCTGNHERSHEKGNALNKDNYTYLINRGLRKGLKNVSNISFLENSYDSEIINANINGLNVIATHGDKVAKSSPSYKLSALLDQKIDLLCLGHWHESRMETNHRTIVHINGSMVSSDEYARNMNLFAYPTQKLLIIGNKYVEACYDIRLDIING